MARLNKAIIRRVSFIMYRASLLISCIFFLSACGSGSNTGSSGTGSIAATVQWDYRAENNNSDRLAAKVPANVYTLTVTLLDTNNNPVSGFSQTKSVTIISARRYS